MMESLARGVGRHLPIFFSRAFSVYRGHQDPVACVSLDLMPAVITDRGFQQVYEGSSDIVVGMAIGPSARIKSLDKAMMKGSWYI